MYPVLYSASITCEGLHSAYLGLCSVTSVSKSIMNKEFIPWSMLVITIQGIHSLVLFFSDQLSMCFTDHWIQATELAIRSSSAEGHSSAFVDSNFMAHHGVHDNWWGYESWMTYSCIDAIVQLNWKAYCVVVMLISDVPSQFNACGWPHEGRWFTSFQLCFPACCFDLCPRFRLCYIWDPLSLEGFVCHYQQLYLLKWCGMWEAILICH